jgi:hypothetical protein
MKNWKNLEEIDSGLIEVFSQFFDGTEENHEKPQ